ncbi:DegV family protein [Clostridium sp. LY3-2]|uniref:DegV family protein n=1 Tax=Clostridium sp. LY3-2 TaxID=2942482 RepID=UPI002152F579|nr:DegV family protein [Clostridium sp. LY3-2]MCR6516113.1 DegV family protein [Clostridium sp. LY3-2]
MSVKIITDSTSYIPKEIKEELDIEVVSLNVIFNGESYREVDIKNEDFYKKLEETGEIPTSSQPAISEVLEIFKNKVSNGDKIVGIFMSSEMSGTYQTANMIKEMVLEEYPEAEIEIIDSRTNCMQMGYGAIVAAREAKKGKDIQDVVLKANDTLSKSRFLFLPETLKYLKKGGRIGGAQALLGGLLKITPILTVEDGKTTIYSKVRTKKRAVEAVSNKVIEDMLEKGLGEITIHHINCEDEGIALKQNIEAKLKEHGLETNVLIESIGPIIGLVSIGVAYYTKN